MVLYRRGQGAVMLMPATTEGSTCPEQGVTRIMAMKLQYHMISHGPIAVIAFIAFMQ
jgi:hypothetical protein